MSKKNVKKSASSADWLRENKWAILILIAAAIIFIVFRSIATDDGEQQRGDEYAEYEKASVTQILTDSSESSEAAEGLKRGEQQLIVKVT